jgi:hypothetical protein
LPKVVILGIKFFSINGPLSGESPTSRKAGGLDFSAIGGKIQRHGSALIGAGVKTPNRKIQIIFSNSIPVQKRGPHHIQKKTGGLRCF